MSVVRYIWWLSSGAQVHESATDVSAGWVRPFEQMHNYILYPFPWWHEEYVEKNYQFKNALVCFCCVFHVHIRVRPAALSFAREMILLIVNYCNNNNGDLFALSLFARLTPASIRGGDENNIVRAPLRALCLKEITFTNIDRYTIISRDLPRRHTKRTRRQA